MSRQLSIEAFFDFVCPWCLIGKRQLEHALAELRIAQPDVTVNLTWKGVQLLPGIAGGGEPLTEFYLRRLGSEQAVSLRQAQVRAAAQSAGLDIDFSGIALMPNTADAHRLLAHAARVGSQVQCAALLERLFSAYFHNGEDLGDTDTLLTLAQEYGFVSADLIDSLAGDGRPFIVDGMPTNGVPHFIFNEHLALSGAQPAQVLHRAMLEALRQGSLEHEQHRL